MNNYIDTNNKIWGFDSKQSSLIPAGAVEIPNNYTSDQYPYLTLVDGIINFDSSAYNTAVTNQKISSCKEKAKSILQETDWTEIPSVTNSSNATYLVNAADFVEYRNAIRFLAINPIENPIWPVAPTEQWS
jgi:hypothetical protein